MNFDYNSYVKLINLTRDHGYEIVNYHNWDSTRKSVILRHDIDTSLEKAVKLAKIEHSQNIKSTYFVLVSSDFYNVFSKKSSDALREIIENGHEVALHFDEMRYSENSRGGGICKLILEEAEMLRTAIGEEIKVVSMHRPSRRTLETDIDIPGMINSYSKTFFKEFKYLSDSRRCWREPVEEIIVSEEYDRLHILTHAFWYGENENSLHDTVASFINSANYERYLSMRDNITDLANIMREDEII